MKTLKIMSIVGIVWFSLCFLGWALCSADSDYYTAAGYAIYETAYGLALSIVTLVQAVKHKKDNQG